MNKTYAQSWDKAYLIREIPLFARRVLFTFTVVLVASLHAQSNVAPPPLGLLRLKSEARTGETAPIAPATFSIDELSASDAAGARKAKKSNVDYVALDSGSEWSRPLRGNFRKVTFVSFQVFASQSTLIDLAGAKLGVTASDVAGHAQLMVKSGSDDWRSLSLHLPFERYEGKRLAALPVLTVRLDPSAGVFDIYSDARLLADSLPLVSDVGARRFVLTPGPDGAWITGLVQSDENPLYEDANANGIDDRFEQRKKGRLLASTASLADRKQLAQEWRMDQMTSVPPALFFNRPRPDGK